MSIRVSGASDDLIEVDGDISEEFNVLGNAAQGSILGFSNGVLLRVAFDNEGTWRITRLKGGVNTDTVIEYADLDDDQGSDVAILHGPVDWVVCGHEWARR